MDGLLWSVAPPGEMGIIGGATLQDPHGKCCRLGDVYIQHSSGTRLRQRQSSARLHGQTVCDHHTWRRSRRLYTLLHPRPSRTILNTPSVEEYTEEYTLIHFGCVHFYYFCKTKLPYFPPVKPVGSMNKTLWNGFTCPDLYISIQLFKNSKVP